MKRETTITIAGGGLAGLALGIGLRNRGVAVKLLEAGSYPRHRVCGEFICGMDASTLENLGITGAFTSQVMNRDSRWFYRGRPVLTKHLPKPAIGISRHHLDHWLAQEFARLGGCLETHPRASETQLADEATVWASGRQRSRDGKWIGLKCHVRGFGRTMDTDLQMHFGEDCYVGISQVEDDTVNVCGLFRQRKELKGNDRSGLLLRYLRASRLDSLADGLEAAEMIPDSLVGVSAFQLGAQPDPQNDQRLNLGDSFSMIPPFTGNGMTMAFQSAELALQPLVDYARGESAWPHTVAAIRAAHRKKFNRRVRWAMRLHPFLLNPIGQKSLVTLAKLRAIPFGLFFKKTR
jgi:flavin-dependent dehydrogenase